MKLTNWTDKDLRDEERAERLARGEESAILLMNMVTEFVWTTKGGRSEIIEGGTI